MKRDSVDSVQLEDVLRLQVQRSRRVPPASLPLQETSNRLHVDGSILARQPRPFLCAGARPGPVVAAAIQRPDQIF